MKKKDEDLVVIGLYSMFYSKYMEARKFERELIKHISKNYITKKGCSAEDIVTDNAYGSESDLDQFLESLKEDAKRKTK